VQIDFLRVLQGEPEKQDEQDKSNDGGDKFHQQVLSGGSANMAVSHIWGDISKGGVVPAKAGPHAEHAGQLRLSVRLGERSMGPGLRRDDVLGLQDPSRR
jgi:hypothetical protein